MAHPTMLWVQGSVEQNAYSAIDSKDRAVFHRFTLEEQSVSHRLSAASQHTQRCCYEKKGARASTPGAHTQRIRRT
jgi:hypothetical protein